MWKYIKLIPLILYPYVYLAIPIAIIWGYCNPDELERIITGIFQSLSIGINNVIQSIPFKDSLMSAIENLAPYIESFLQIIPSLLQFFAPSIAYTTVFGYTFLVLYIAISNTVACVNGKYTVLQGAKLNLIAKSLQIPIYLFHFAMGAFSFILSVWGAGFLLVAIVVDLLAIITTGINVIGCAVRMYDNRILSKKVAIALGICSFIYCIDLPIAIIYVVMAKSNKKAKEKQADVIVGNTELNVV